MAGAIVLVQPPHDVTIAPFLLSLSLELNHSLAAARNWLTRASACAPPAAERGTVGLNRRRKRMQRAMFQLLPAAQG